ncbi:hypothetical protein AJ79_08313 [Helicocarpus griseus UAMH5409]|uniref:AAA+ ATPase domain-containing protein n=1 Tax=Helicocarpus griseus UAMH5409 TaxID=1447875 RepID=A0A2B7WU82_9EURO|nr:hypothetical protein AJ79_08313 [Helicocarpus griseus UAMH5409]
MRPEMLGATQMVEHLALIEEDDKKGSNSSENVARLEEIRTTPLFTSNVKLALQLRHPSIIPQYALLGVRKETYGSPGCSNGNSGFENSAFGNTGNGLAIERHSIGLENLVYANINAPSSTFICGSQGSGKSHTLSCMLENGLVHPSVTGAISSPLTGLVLHYDKFTGVNTGQLCEAAYLSSKIPVRVLVSPSNFAHMEKLYANLPGLPKGTRKPKVHKMYFREDQLTIGMMKDLMAVSAEGTTPLYMEVVTKVLRDMAEESQGRRGINFEAFKLRLREEGFDKGQTGPLNMRLQLLESFLGKSSKKAQGTSARNGINKNNDNIWEFPKGSLTIVDLSCPFVDENDACSLFNICMSIFMERRNEGGRIVALDEAHKFLTTNTREAINLTDTLLSLIRQQRHLATRVIIATQEPTLSPNLLDLCNVAIVHRFSSPAWFKTLRNHLAAAAFDDTSQQKFGSTDNLFSRIVTLKTGEALVFCPSAMLDLVAAGILEGTRSLSDGLKPNGVSMFKESKIRELGPRYMRVRIRKRITTDGGRSILAEE